jgi:hypothetical protein
MRIAQVLSIADADYQTLGVDMQSEINFNQGVVLGLDFSFTLLASQTYSFLFAYNSGFAKALQLDFSGNALNKINFFYTFGGAVVLNLSANLKQTDKNLLVFYFLLDGTTISADVFINSQKIGRYQTTISSVIRNPRLFMTSAVPQILQTSSIMLVDIGTKTDDELMGYFDILNSLNCDSRKALDLVNAVVPKTEPKDLFNAVVGYLTDFGGQDPQDVIATLREIIGAVYPITAGPIPETRASGVIVGVYEQGPTTITEKGPLLEFSSSVAIEVQAPDDTQLFEVLDFIEQTINFLNWKTPASITQRRVWHKNETDINKAYAFCVSQIKTYKWR